MDREYQQTPNVQERQDEQDLAEEHLDRDNEEDDAGEEELTGLATKIKDPLATGASAATQRITTRKTSQAQSETRTRGTTRVPITLPTSQPLPKEGTIGIKAKYLQNEIDAPRVPLDLESGEDESGDDGNGDDETIVFS